MDERVRSLLARGREAYRSGEYELAERLLGELALEDQPFADVYAMLGVIQHRRDRMADAERSFQRALFLNPAYTEAALNLAVIYNDLGRYAEAREVYERMLAARAATPASLDPFVKAKIANMHADVGRAYEDAGLMREAIVELRKALALCPTFVDIRTRLGACLRAAGEVGAAVEELERAKAANPRFVACRLHLGMAHFAAGRKDEARREWTEAKELEPGNRFAQLYLKMLG